jgi:hypothetical protein
MGESLRENVVEEIPGGDLVVEKEVGYHLVVEEEVGGDVSVGKILERGLVVVEKRWEERGMKNQLEY